MGGLAAGLFSLSAAGLAQGLGAAIRAFKELADQKGWDTPDIVIAERALTVSR